MRNSYWLVTFLLVLECTVLLVLIEPAQCFLSFIPVSVHTALQILTMLVKIKSIIFKILLGLKLMGVEGFIMRRRRRSIHLGDEYDNDLSSYHHPTDYDSKSYLDWKLGELPEEQRTELLTTWERLERILGQNIEFQEGACIEAVSRIGRKPIALWRGARELLKSSDSFGRGDPRSRSTSFWISTLLGSSLGSLDACHILDKQLNYSRPLDIPTNSNSYSAYYSSSPQQAYRSSRTAYTINSSVLSKSLLETGAFS